MKLDELNLSLFVYLKLGTKAMGAPPGLEKRALIHREFLELLP